MAGRSDKYDLAFLGEMKEHVDAIKNHTDITRIESLAVMIDDWIDELVKRIGKE